MEPRFVIAQDDSGHYYIVPEECRVEFERLLADGADDEWDTFERVFGLCRLGSHISCYTFGYPMNDDGEPVYAVYAQDSLKAHISPRGEEQENSEDEEGR